MEAKEIIQQLKEMSSDKFKQNVVRKMMTQVYSWDLCDHICKNLIIKIPGYQDLILEWCDNSNTYYRRAVFTLIASVSVHEKNVTEEEITSYLNLIKECSEDNREHVKKAVSWALREIGKIDYNYLERAI